MEKSDLTHSAQAMLDETGGDFYFADLFIETAKQVAEEAGGYIPQRTINIFYKEVERCRKNWEKRNGF